MTVESDDCGRTGAIVVVETKLEVVSYVEDTLHVEIDVTIEERSADSEDGSTVDMTVFDVARFGVKEEVRVTTDKGELAT